MDAELESTIAKLKQAAEKRSDRLSPEEMGKIIDKKFDDAIKTKKKEESLKSYRKVKEEASPVSVVNISDAAAKKLGQLLSDLKPEETKVVVQEKKKEEESLLQKIVSKLGEFAKNTLVALIKMVGQVIGWVAKTITTIISKLAHWILKKVALAVGISAGKQALGTGRALGRKGKALQLLASGLTGAAAVYGYQELKKGIETIDDTGKEWQSQVDTAFADPEGMVTDSMSPDGVTFSPSGTTISDTSPGGPSGGLPSGSSSEEEEEEEEEPTPKSAPGATAPELDTSPAAAPGLDTSAPDQPTPPVTETSDEDPPVPSPAEPSLELPLEGDPTTFTPIENLDSESLGTEIAQVVAPELVEPTPIEEQVESKVPPGLNLTAQQEKLAQTAADMLTGIDPRTTGSDEEKSDSPDSRSSSGGGPSLAGGAGGGVTVDQQVAPSGQDVSTEIADNMIPQIAGDMIKNKTGGLNISLDSVDSETGAGGSGGSLTVSTGGVSPAKTTTGSQITPPQPPSIDLGAFIASNQDLHASLQELGDSVKQKSPKVVNVNKTEVVSSVSDMNTIEAHRKMART